METANKTEMKEFLIDQLLTGTPDMADPFVSSKFAELRRDDIAKPVIYIGTGTCGLGAGAEATYLKTQRYIEDHQLDVDVIKVGCIGFCAAEPLVDVQLPGKNRISFKNVTGDKVNDVLESAFTLDSNNEHILGQFRSEKLDVWENVPFIDEHPFFAPQKRIVLKNCGLVNPINIEEYVARGGYNSFLETIKKYSSFEVCDMIEKSGLRGRGGGGFPTGKKWKFANGTEADQKYLICNADEGDPGAFMDRAVIEGDPHRLIEGMAIAAFGIGATKGYVYIRAEYPLAIERLKIALTQAREYGLLGKNIFDSGFDFDIIIKMGAGAFVCGEETALIHSIEGKRGMPRPRPPFPAVNGLFGKPTIINNVETLSNLPEIMARGEAWFASIGTEKSKGTKVFALSGNITLTGLVEIPMGTTVREIIFDIAGGIPNNKKFKSVQIGGPSGGCITEENLDIQVDYESLISVGAMMGSGGLVVMDENTCMVDVAKFFMDFIQRESCGKCIPCREGTRRMLEILESITSKPNKNNEKEALQRFKGIVQLEKLGKVIKETSLCGLGQTAPNPVLSTLKWFRDEYESHIYERKCDPNVCTELRTYKIDIDLCTGCMACVRKCPVNAIVGARKTHHFIVEDLCIGCGSCVDACKFDAISIS
ncbi:MAG TPA: NADH-ubiquinone oxidoreductase-F iron-sulfur binding region domain-containing protein [Bacteroidales bacterium]|nr:NADH-ubiquinone oxidoreductase-F iron-sulfur binding region domain-containing protein [Bacteroidales bacterium]